MAQKIRCIDEFVDYEQGPGNNELWLSQVEKTMITGIIYTPEFLLYTNNPENKGRVSATVEYFKTKGIDEFISPLDYDERYVKSVHNPAYIETIKSYGVIEGNELKYPNVLLSTNGCLTAGEMLAEGIIDNGFVLNRPPGHHAYANKGGGFCYLNNAAILAKYIQDQGFEKVMIVDWDAHHGNGTESIFYHDPSVLYTSIHQTPLYPWTGKVTDTGSGQGEGYTVNVPVPPGTGHDTYMEIFDEVIIPVGKKFRPNALIISAGQDSHRDDPLTNLRLCPASYYLMTERLIQSVCSKTVGILEGGYNSENVARANYAIVSALMDKENNNPIESNDEPENARQAIRRAKEIVAERW
jgi:acetoin utilization deacetylase AcuC-like enzyme